MFKKTLSFQLKVFSVAKRTIWVYSMCIVCLCTCVVIHFPHSSRSVQRLCPSAVISLKQGKGDIIVCSRLFHSRQSVSVWVSSSPVSALLYNTLLNFAPPFYSQCHQKADSRVWCSIIFSALWKCPHTYLQLPRAHTNSSCCNTHFCPHALSLQPDGH